MAFVFGAFLLYFFYFCSLTASGVEKNSVKILLLCF